MRGPRVQIGNPGLSNSRRLLISSPMRKSVPLDDLQFEKLLRRVAESQARAGQVGGPERQRILFLGNRYNPLSTVCLQTLVELGYDPVVGVYDPLTKGAWQLFRKKLMARGWGFVLRRTLLLIRCKTRIAFRRMGGSLLGFASVPELSRARGLDTIRCTNPNSAEFVQQVQLLGLDLVLVAAFGRILKRELIGIPRLGCVNVHPSLLPRFRGPEPFYWILAKQEKMSGVTLHYMDEGIDSGDIILQRELKIRPNETEITLTDRSARLAAELLREAIPRLFAGQAPRIRQDHSAATYYTFPQKGASVLRQRTRILSSQTGVTSKNISIPVHAIDPLQDPRWGAFIEEHPRASVFHTIPWLNALQRTYKYKPTVYTTSPGGVCLQNGLVFCSVESWVTGRRLVSLPFSDHCEPLVDSPKEMDSILSYLQAYRRSGDWKYIEIRPVDSRLFGASKQEGFQPSKEYYQHSIDLRPPDGELFRRFHKSSVQRRIRRAEQAGLACECGRSSALLRKFYQLMLMTRRRHHLPPQPEGWFRNLAECMGDALEVWVASLENRAVASIITLRFKNTLVFKYGSSDSAYHRFGPVPLLLWRAIQQAKSNGVQVFDLGRSDYYDKGLVVFKDRWASTRSLLTYWKFPAPAAGLLVDEGREFKLAKQFFGFLPQFVQKAVGEILYRHIG
jgi:folate-dependent phosphoribosylglycinamide formyltransferase PurN/CelD/BcsL family acetyltransferase involved in cellulose biosynthesis